MTTRRWMVAVAVLALAIGMDRLVRRSIAFRERADRLARYEVDYRELQRFHEKTLRHIEQARLQIEGRGPLDDEHLRTPLEAQCPDAVDIGFHRQQAAWAARADRCSRWRREYERAATHPWEILSLTPPPQPIERD
jgi:hypothetical protein